MGCGGIMLLFNNDGRILPQHKHGIFRQVPPDAGRFPKSQRHIGKKLMFSCNQREGCGFMRIVHYRQFLSEDMGNDLLPKGEESIFVGFFILINMERRDFKGIIPLRGDFIMGDPFEIHPDVKHQHMEMQ
jgi:hypothetical protein